MLNNFFEKVLVKIFTNHFLYLMNTLILKKYLNEKG